MDRLWSPWRYRFVAEGAPKDHCVFCEIWNRPENDESNFVVHRAERNFVVLNLYPYTVGHILIVPHAHESNMTALDESTVTETMLLARSAEEAIETAYKPHGLNAGLNIGAAAGAGIAQHIHMHVLPRWTGDANFMSTIGETRMLAEELPETAQKLRAEFARIRGRLP